MERFNSEAYPPANPAPIYGNMVLPPSEEGPLIEGMSRKIVDDADCEGSAT
jgi:hypothetical protein